MSIQFVNTDAEELSNNLITAYEEQIGETLYPGDERRIFLLQFLQWLIGVQNNINYTGQQNLLRYAVGENLDAIGEMHGTVRLQAQQAVTTFKITLSASQNVDITIPTGTRATPDNRLYFATAGELVIPSGEIEGTVTAQATEPGKEYNGFAPGQVKLIVDQIPFVSKIENTTQTQGGSDMEADTDYRERIRLAPQSFSSAGPSGAYEYWARSADESISDVAVYSPSPGQVNIMVLLEGGQIPGTEILSKVEAACNDKTRRPLTDYVIVEAPGQEIYNIDLQYYIAAENANQATTIQAVVQQAVIEYQAWQSAKLGRDINPDELKKRILNAGAYMVEIAEPAYTEIDNTKVPQADAINVVYSGLKE